MIITQERLITLAEDAVAHWAERQPILAAYLIGSVLDEQPLLGGVTDIDIIIIENDEPIIDRQIQPLSDDVHLDIAFHSRELYAKPRNLRLDPWLGPALWHHHRIHDPKHFFDWAQAGAVAQFRRPENVLGRAMAFLRSARDQGLPAPKLGWLAHYLRATMDGLNAIVSLAGPPASGRRSVLTALRRLEPLGLQDVHAGFLGLFDAIEPDEWHLPEWLTAWGKAFDQQSEFRSADLAPARRGYYLRAFQSMAESGKAAAVIWPLLKTWLDMIDNIEDLTTRELHQSELDQVKEQLRLSDQFRDARLSQLESFLDRIELSVEEWAGRHGIEGMATWS